jgi:cutinase
MRTFPVLYSASIATNISPTRTDAKSISKGVSTFNQAQNCRVIVAGGYSQGAAVMHNSVSKLSAALKSKIAGVALFGDTRNLQDGGHIKNFPRDRSKVWCKAGDGVCRGTLAVGASHLSYSQVEAQSAGTWLAQKAKSHR